jgi:hypothetical protein
MLNFLRLVCNIAERIMYAVLIIMVALILLSTLQGCSVNVIVAPHATLGVSSDLSQNALQELEREQE